MIMSSYIIRNFSEIFVLFTAPELSLYIFFGFSISISTSGMPLTTLTPLALSYNAAYS